MFVCDSAGHSLHIIQTTMLNLNVILLSIGDKTGQILSNFCLNAEKLDFLKVCRTKRVIIKLSNAQIFNFSCFFFF